MNVNFLGEAILSEADAGAPVAAIPAAACNGRRSRSCPSRSRRSTRRFRRWPASTPWPRSATGSSGCSARPTGRAFTRPDGQVVPKFVYLDMEEYRDKELTAEAFMRTLDRPGLEQVRAGIALQSYIPDSFRTLLEIQEWARRRVAAGGGRITIRLVKGANMEMRAGRRPRCAAGRRRLTRPRSRPTPITSGWCTRCMKPENLAAMDVGVASHNLFDLAYGLVLAHERNAHGQGAVRDARRAWPTTSAARCSSCRATCCSTPRPARRRTSSMPSAT